MGSFFTYAGVSRDLTEVLKVWIAGGGVVLVIAWRWLPRRWALGLLSTLTLVATLNYFRWGARTAVERVDTYDLIHYYLNAKFFDELGYLDLYPACIVADREAGGPYFKKEGNVYMAQDDRGHHLDPIESGVAAGQVVKARFTPERWAAFSHDFLYLQRAAVGLSEETWRQMLQDHGFNGTTFWTAIARPIAEHVPVEYVKWLGWIDAVLLLAGTLTVGWAFGAPTALWAWFFFMVSYSLRWPTITWAFFRYDYVFGLMMATALLKRGRPALAAVFAGYSALLRLFPAMWSWGVLPSIRRMPRYFVALALAVGVLQGLATLDLGVESVKVHLENMEDHNRAEQLSSRRIGVAHVFVTSGELLPKTLTKEMKHKIDEQKPMRLAMSGALLLFGLYALRRAPAWEGYGLGFLPFFLLTTASYYYYVARITLIVVHAADLKKPRNVFGLAWLLGLEVFCNRAESAHPDHRMYLIGWLSRGLLAYTVILLAWRAWDARNEPELTEG